MLQDQTRRTIHSNDYVVKIDDAAAISNIYNQTA